MIPTRSIAPLLAAALVALPLLSCFSDRTAIVAPGGDGCEVPASAIGPDQAVVFIRGFAFFPATIRIAPGTRVTWVNCESEEVEPHTSTAASTAESTWDSGLIAPGESFAQTFTATGTNGYFCIPHPFMVGAVIVE
jgi:plastocyanin